MTNEIENSGNSIFYTIMKWLYLSIDAFFSLTAIYSILKAAFGPSNESCGAAFLFIITFPVAVVLNLILLIVVIIRKIRQKKKAKQVLKPFDPYKIEEEY